MPCIRVSLMRSKDPASAEAAGIVDELITYMATQPGYVTGWRMTAHDGTGLLGRITIWETEADADHAAQTDRVLSLRSQLNPLVEEGSHEEHALEGHEVRSGGAA